MHMHRAHWHMQTEQEPIISTPMHKDYLPDVTQPESNASDYEQEEEEEEDQPEDNENEYDEYQENLHNND